MTDPGVIARQRYKVVVLGAPAAGKTALVRRIVDGTFFEVKRQRGLDFYTCHIILRDDVTVALQLWDLSDCPCRPEDDTAPLSAYVLNSQAVLLVYDVSCPSSLEALGYALRTVEAAATANRGALPYLALVANKCDLQWTASEALARELAARHGCVRYSLSARSGYGVSRAAVQLACDLAGVPLAAATEHSALLLEPDTMLLPPGFMADPGTLVAPGHEQATSTAVDAYVIQTPSAALEPPPSGLAASSEGVVAAAAAPQRQMTAGKFHKLAPTYEAMAQTTPQVSGPGSLDELSMYGMGGGVQYQSWRPVSRSAKPSQATVLVSRTGALGQRILIGSPQQAATSEDPGLASPDQGAMLPSETGQALIPEYSGSQSKNVRKGPWKGWGPTLCCLGFPSAV